MRILFDKMSKHIFLLLLLLIATPARADITSGLVGWWKLDENAANTTVLDSSGNAITGTATNNTSTLHVDGKIGSGAMSFDGSQYVALGTPAAIGAVVYPYTVSFWAKPTTLAQNGVIASFANNGPAYAAAYGLYLGVNRIEVGNAGHMYGLSGISTYLTAGQWAMWTMVWTDATTLSFYINGDLKAIDYEGNYLVYSGNFIGESGTGLRFTGSIDDVRIYNRALSGAEVAELYQYNVAHLGGAQISNAHLGH